MTPVDGSLGELTARRASPPLADALLSNLDWLIGLLTRRFGPDEARDLVQDVYVAARGYTPSAPIRSPKALLLRMALNIAAKRHRRAVRETVTDPFDLTFARLQSLPAQEQAAQWAQIMQRLPRKLRDVFILNHVTGMTYGEIAKLQGISVKTVEKHMHKALVLCRQLMQG